MPKATPLQIELPADLTAPYVVPEDADRATIDATVAAIRKDADALLDDNKKSDRAPLERIEAAEWLISAIDTLTTRGTELATADKEQADRAQSLRDRLDGGDKPGESEDGDEGGADDEHRDGDDPDDEGTNSGGNGVVENAPTEPVLVASSGRRSVLAGVLAQRNTSGSTGQQVQPKVEAREAFLTAAANVGGFDAGAKLSMLDMGAAVSDRFNALPDAGPEGGPQTRLPIGKVHVASDPSLVASKRTTISKAMGGQGYDLDAAIEWALSRDRLKRETGQDSLVAAAGWCAPSETLYDLVDVTTDDGMIDIAGITVNRGGVRYSLGPDFSAIYSGGQNFTQTEAQNIANTVKPVVNVPCPTFTDNRMLVDGMYLTGDILAAKGYPEAYADFTGKALKAFAHYVNAKSIADMVNLCTAVDLRQPGASPTYFENLSVTTELLGAVELQITDMRYRNRMSLTDEVEVVFPVWAKGVIRSDMAKRAAIEDPGTITDAMIANWFALRFARVQWVYDWQDFFASGAGMGAATPALSWPTQVSFMVYPAGGFVRALSDVIELNAIYDSVLLKTNQYVALFMEQARLVLKRVPDCRVVTTKVLITGATGAAVDYTTATRQPTV